MSKRIWIAWCLLAALFLSACHTNVTINTTNPTAPATEPSAAVTEPTTPPTAPTTEPTVPTTEPTEPRIGWYEENGDRYYYDENSVMLTGWQTIDEKEYYFREDGSMARGMVMIDDVAHFFTSTGAPILMVNPWYSLPADYTPDLVALSTAISVEGMQVDRSCYEALKNMVSDGSKAMRDQFGNNSHELCILSSYRTNEYQQGLFQRKINYYLNLGYDQAEAERLAATVIAIPGTSEHQLGLAVDIVDTTSWSLTEAQADLPGQRWLMENCWKYGFILRFPKDKTDVTGIIYEPWHYRYVGVEVATELHESGLTLEEYIASLTK